MVYGIVIFLRSNNALTLRYLLVLPHKPAIDQSVRLFAKPIEGEKRTREKDGKREGMSVFTRAHSMDTGEEKP